MKVYKKTKLLLIITKIINIKFNYYIKNDFEIIPLLVKY